MNISLPGTFIRDLMDSLECHTHPSAETLAEKIDAATPKRRGRGYVLIIDADEDETALLLSEADYRAEYWGTSAYGVTYKEPGRANAARKVASVIRALTEVGN